MSYLVCISTDGELDSLGFGFGDQDISPMEIPVLETQTNLGHGKGMDNLQPSLQCLAGILEYELLQVAAAIVEFQCDVKLK